jgi:hypothetical protein
MTAADATRAMSQLQAFNSLLINANAALTTYRRYASNWRLGPVYKSKYLNYYDQLYRNINSLQSAMDTIDQFQKGMREVFSQLPSNP